MALGQDDVLFVQILQDADLSLNIGSEILLGYGISPDEMLASARYRTLYTITQPQ